MTTPTIIETAIAELRRFDRFAEADAVQALLDASKNALPYIGDVAHADGGLAMCEITVRTDYEALQTAMGAE